MSNFEIRFELAELSRSKDTRKALTVTAWENRDATLDLRTWKDCEDGERIPCEGLTLTIKEARLLKNTLNDFFDPIKAHDKFFSGQ